MRAGASSGPGPHLPAAALALAVLAPLAARGAGEEPAGEAARREAARTVAVLIAQDLAPYRRAIASFSAEYDGPARLYQLGQGEEASRLFAALRRRPPAMVLALGPLAIAAATRELPDVPALFLMVPNLERLGLSGRVSGVRLAVPARAQLEALRAGWPSATRVLVVHDPRYAEAELESLRRAAEDFGITIAPIPVRAPDVVAEALSAAGSADAVWMTADRTVASLQAFKAIAEHAKRKAVPFMALSEEQVRQGATLAVVASYTGMGRQAARLAARVVAGADPRGLPVEYPEEMNISVATGAARAAGGSMWGLAEMAARNGWQLRPSP